MSLIETIKTKNKNYQNQQIPEAIASELLVSAQALSKRNLDLTNLEDNQAQADETLNKNPREANLVRLADQQAKLEGLTMADWVETLTPEFKTAYEQALLKVGDCIDVRRFNPEPLAIDFALTTLDQEIHLYTPVLWVERNKEILPGAIHLLSLQATMTCLQDVANLKDPFNYGGISRTIIETNQPDQLRKSLSDYLVHEIPKSIEQDEKLRQANISIRAYNLSCNHTVHEILPSGKKDTDPTQTNYSVLEAAMTWRQHEIDQGTVNGSEQNYVMKLHNRLSEGRVLAEPKGTISKSNLDDFLQLNDIRRYITKNNTTRLANISFEEAAQVLGTSSEYVQTQVTERNIPSSVQGRVTLSSLNTFLKSNTLRNGQWVDFKNQRNFEIDKTSQQINQPRENYLTIAEAEAEGLSYHRLRRLRKNHKVNTFHDDKKSCLLFDREEIKPYLP